LKLHTADFALDCVEFADRYGMIRVSYGCSLLGTEEFRARLEALTNSLEAAKGDMTIAKLYKQDKLFRHHCDRCLQLNNIEPDWLDAKGLILEGLLFLYEGNAGLLVRLNSTEPTQPAAASEEAATVYDVGASLLALSNDLGNVIEQLNTLPAKQAGRILEARAKQGAAANPEEKQKGDRREWAAKMRSKSEGRAINVAELQAVQPL
jgi:hypothetical protein